MMKRGDVIRYADMTSQEGMSLQRGMYFNVYNKSYGIILMSRRPHAPYTDQFKDDGKTIIYQGHDAPFHLGDNQVCPKKIDQPFCTPKGSLTENGKFLKAVMDYQNGKPAKILKVYEKIKVGIWVYNGFFSLIDAWSEVNNERRVFKFKLEMIDEVSPPASHQEIVHNRLIPTQVKVFVWQRDKGKCVKCGSKENLHFDHIIPYSKGGSSTNGENIQLLCAKCNLSKHDHIE